MTRFLIALRNATIVFLFLPIVSSEVYSRSQTEAGEIEKVIEKRKEWLMKNAIAGSTMGFDKMNSHSVDRQRLAPGSYYYYLDNTEYRGEIVVNEKDCLINGFTPCAGSIGESDYAIPVIRFSGFFSSHYSPAALEAPTYMPPSAVIGHSGPVIEREHSYTIKVDPLTWFLILGCSSVNAQIDCEAARREGAERRGNYFYIQSDGTGRIIQVDEYWGNQLMERQRFFYDSSASLMDQFALEYREARGHYSLLYVFDPLGNRGRHALFGY